MADMKPNQAFDLTLKIHKLKAADIARKSGKAASFISTFRNGNADVKAETLVELVKAMPDYARSTFWGLCMSTDSDVTHLKELTTKCKKKAACT